VDEAAFRATTRGGQASIGRALGPTATLTATFGRQRQSSEIADAAVADPAVRDELIALGLDPVSGEQSGLLSTLTLDAVRVALDDFADPRHGHAATLRLEGAGGWLQGNYSYTSVIGEIRGYMTPARSPTLAARVRFGAIDPSGVSSNVPFFKRFFLGGATSLRGWGHSHVAPLSSGGLPLGGHSMFEASAELRSPLWKRVGIVAFADAGNVWRTPWTLRLDDLLSDAGVGVRYASPFGLVRLDLAYQLKRLDGLRLDGVPQTGRWRIQIGAGQMF
jgi:outer membrane translocation and assembly module TamA